MNFYWSSKVWENQLDAPHTSRRAKPTAFKRVKKTQVIILKDAMYRDAVFSGAFLLSEKNQLKFPKTGFYTVEVFCCWFGHRLKTRGLHIKVNMKTALVVLDYEGQVVSNLSI